MSNNKLASFRLPEELHDFINSCIPDKHKSETYRRVLFVIAREIQNNPEILGAILRGNFTIEEIKK